jgi:hypothetical protein
VFGQPHSVHQRCPDGSRHRPRDRVPAGCPTEAIAASIARNFALGPIDYAAVREAHEEAVGTMANVFGETLGEKAMSFERLVGALVTSVWNVGRFYSDKVTKACALSAKLRNDDRAQEWGFESKVQRGRHFVAGLHPVGGGGGCRPGRRGHRRRDLETLCRADNYPDAQPAGCGRRAGGLRRVTKRGSLRAPPSFHSGAQREKSSHTVTDVVQVATSSALLIKPVTARGPARWEFRGV